MSARNRFLVWALIGLCGCDLLDDVQPDPEPELPVLDRPVTPVAATPPPASPRDHWREQVFDPPQVTRPAPKEGVTWHDSLSAAADELATDPRPILILIRCPLSDASGADDDAILAGAGPLAELLTHCVTIVIADAAKLGLRRLNLPVYQDPDQTWWCLLRTPEGEPLSTFGPQGGDTVASSQIEPLASWLSRCLDYYYDARRPDWRIGVSAPEPPDWMPETIESAPRFAEWKAKANELERLRTESNCLCCHQAQDALWTTQPDFNRLIEWWIWPDESVLGITLRNDEPLTIDSVAADSVAASAGLTAGDRIVGIRQSPRFGNWPLFSATDFRMIVQNLGWEDGQFTAIVQRGSELVDIRIQLKNPLWRRYDLSWRKSLLESVHASHPGFLPTQADSGVRSRYGLASGSGMAIVPQIGPASPNFKRGLLPEHVIVQIGYVADNLSNEQFLAMFNVLVPPGGEAPMLVISGRTGRRERLMIRGVSIFEIPREAR